MLRHPSTLCAKALPLLALLLVLPSLACSQDLSGCWRSPQALLVLVQGAEGLVTGAGVLRHRGGEAVLSLTGSLAGDELSLTYTFAQARAPLGWEDGAYSLLREEHNVLTGRWKSDSGAAWGKTTFVRHKPCAP